MTHQWTDYHFTLHNEKPVTCTRVQGNFISSWRNSWPSSKNVQEPRKPTKQQDHLYSDVTRVEDVFPSTTTVQYKVERPVRTRITVAELVN